MFRSASYDAFIRFLETHMLSCPSRRYLHIDCPGCGLQRGIVALLSGDIGQSFREHPAAIPFLLLLIVLVLHLIFRFRRGAGILMGLQLSVAIISLSFYVYKIIHHQILH